MKKVKLLKNHRHKGKDYLAGDKIEVNETTEKYLVEHHIAAPARAKVIEQAVDPESTKGNV